MDFTRDDTKLVKGFAIVLMLYHHLFAFSSRIQEGNSYIPLLTHGNLDSAQLFGLFGKMCVALFLFLGGYGTWKSYHARVAARAAEEEPSRLLSSFTVRKAAGLYRSYLKVFVIVIPLALLFSDTKVTASITALFWNATGLNISYNGEWWFFTDYLILLVAFPPMDRFVGRSHATFPTDLLAICVWNAAVTWIIPSAMEAEWLEGFSGSLVWRKLYQTMQWSSCFLIGCLCARWDVLAKLKSRFAGHHLACIAALFCIAFMICLRYKLGVDYRYDFLYAPVLCLALAVIATSKVGALVSRPLKAIGNHSTNIWLTHSFFCYHWCQWLVFLPKLSVFVFLLLLGMSYALSLAINWLWSWIAKGFRSVDGQLGYQTH